MQWLYMGATIVGIVAVILLLAWGHDRNLKKRIREGLQQRGREENEARARLRELTGGDCGCSE